MSFTLTTFWAGRAARRCPAPLFRDAPPLSLYLHRADLPSVQFVFNDHFRPVSLLFPLDKDAHLRIRGTLPDFRPPVILPCRACVVRRRIRCVRSRDGGRAIDNAIIHFSQYPLYVDSKILKKTLRANKRRGYVILPLIFRVLSKI